MGSKNLFKSYEKQYLGITFVLPTMDKLYRSFLWISQKQFIDPVKLSNEKIILLLHGGIGIGVSGFFLHSY